MPFVLIVAGVVLLVAAVRNTQGELFYLLQRDFTGQNNFIYWFVSIMIIGAIGYIPRLKPISDAFLILVIVVLFLADEKRNGQTGGFFVRLQQQLQSTVTATPGVSGGNKLVSFNTPSFNFTVPGNIRIAL